MALAPHRRQQSEQRRGLPQRARLPRCNQPRERLERRARQKENRQSNQRWESEPISPTKSLRGNSMNSYMIGYDLNKPEQNYINLITTIKESFDNWWHYLDSTWIVTTTLNTVEIRDLLQPHVDNDDELLVVKLTGEGAWAGFNQKASEWLKTNL
jgi:hypothetical protein